MRKTLLLIGFSLFMVGAIDAQSKEVKYTYDASGNRIKREMITIALKNEKNAVDEDFLPTEESWGERQVTIFPNPTKGNLRVLIEGGDGEAKYQYQLYNSAGTLVLNGRIDAHGEHTLPMESLSSGVYILTVVSNDEKLTYKIIKE